MIRITRASEYVDSIRKYNVIVDGKNIGKIKDGMTEEFEIPTGEHTIYLKIDWCRSNKIFFDAVDNETLEFNCGNSIDKSKLLKGFLYITFLKNNYLWIKAK
ncbi:hypothetical protein [[Clostridium] fimetarium]|uniref:PEGA domain-containing protein n=1 Tax=[Clostridium] fimetarium TaxID=99656 RepID=A0A1I0RFD8_9FIRM|nr:hypothetical protein [[Clostridium] fimetarium]SEW39560.1 hypothetical protein SAMN05421659_11521 [[Clostridium] fimetarium]